LVRRGIHTAEDRRTLRWSRWSRISERILAGKPSKFNRVDVDIKQQLLY